MTNHNGVDPDDLLANLEARLRPHSPQLQTEPSGVAGEGDFYSPDEVHEALAAHSQSYNAGPLPHFLGLSPDQMHSMLNRPWDSPSVVVFADPLGARPKAPLLFLFGRLVDAMGEKGLKATEKGNFPRAFCQEARRALLAACPGEDYQEGSVQSEEHFMELHVLHIIANIAGLTRRAKGRIFLTKKCRELLDQGGRAAVYQPLFRAYVDRFNWAYLDGYQNQAFVRSSFLFSLFLLSRLGGRWRPELYYRDKFVRAFPPILEQVEAQVHSTPKEELGHILTMRVFERFCAFFGLAETEARQRIGTWRLDIRIRSLPLLKEVVQFKV